MLHRPLYRRKAGYSFIRSLNPAAWFRADTGVTVTASGASMVADQADPDNALVLPGVAGNYASAPDSVPLSITGDIDIRVRVALNDWTPSAVQSLVAKDPGSPSTNRSYLFYVNTDGTLHFLWSSDGSDAGSFDKASTVATGLTDKSAYWVRVTLDVNNGAAGNDVKFYTAADSATEPTSWTQLGTTVTTVGTTSIFDGTYGLEVGSRTAGATLPAAGKFYRAIIKSGIDGTTVFDANFAAQTKGTTSFSESSSNAATVTVNQSGALPAHIGSQKDLLQGTDASRPPYLSYSGTKYLYLPGVASNYASTPDSVPASITGDIDIRVRVALDDWTPAADSVLIAKMAVAGTRSYRLYVSNSTAGMLALQWSADATTQITKFSTVIVGATDGAAMWVRATLDVDNGAAGNDVKFYTAADSATEPTSWTQLGTTVTTVGTTSIADTGEIVEAGTFTNGTLAPWSGKLYRAIIKNGIDGTTVVDFNPDLDGSDQAATITSSATGEVWTINKSGGLPAQIVGRNSLLFDGSADYLKCNAFTLNQPETVYIAFKQVSWTGNDTVLDGDALNSMRLYQVTATPELRIYAGTSVAANTGLAVGSYGVVSAVFNGASSLNQVNLGTPATGNAGAANAGGFTLGANGTIVGTYSNIQVLEVIIFSTSHDATQRARIISYLAGRHGIAL